MDASIANKDTILLNNFANLKYFPSSMYIPTRTYMMGPTAAAMYQGTNKNWRALMSGSRL